MKESKKVKGLVIGVIGVVLSFIVFFAISVILGAGLLNVLGFEYTSIGAVILFFVIYTILAFFIEPFVEAYVMAITELGRLNVFFSEAIGLVFCVGFDVVLVSFIESIISGIIISHRTIVFFSMITYIIGKISEAQLHQSEVEENNVSNEKKENRNFLKKKRKSKE